MSAESLQLLPGYYGSPKWFFGVLGNYRFERQQIALSDTANTNATGAGWLVGPVLTY